MVRYNKSEQICWQRLIKSGTLHDDSSRIARETWSQCNRTAALTILGAGVLTVQPRPVDHFQSFPASTGTAVSEQLRLRRPRSLSPPRKISSSLWVGHLSSDL